MKIYTFNAAEDTRVEMLWSLRSQNRDKIFSQFIAENRYTEVDSIQDCDVAIYPNKAFTPETLAFDSSVYQAAQSAQTYRKPLIIDATSDSDVLLDIPWANILRNGLYKSLKKSFETECPYWSNERTKRGLDSLDISPKGKKPVIGFCGTTSSRGKLANLSKSIVPDAVTRLVLSQGKLSRRVDPRIIEGMSLQLRETVMKILAIDSRLEVCFDVTNNRQSYYVHNESNKIALENLFITNTDKSDYVLCVRGGGNFSGRFYMALNAGRIPVVIDTDGVIPYEEQLHLIKVPVNSLNKLPEVIAEHFATTTEQELKEMKRENRLAYHQLLSPEKFLPNYIRQCCNKTSGVAVSS
ncbi:hypothetical protein C7B62_11245 [Pleurocapsa sp. CCALA 161]|uniref:hypothetical protein n=1 Tax=Pleurocapsa sp. CCALA 161 TaxID=2107688 RepID=UPI000D04E25B|nr:hypothetical protein [Pleurocapsa sp. CCALA 161]PSB09989.1 hypothetical protein C7B62_11245 [Pleurocapsa sp. CCALA 161]